MFYLKCTGDVQKRLGLFKLASAEAMPTGALLDHWYIHRITIERRNVFIFMSESTYLSFILYQGKRPVTAATLPTMMLAGIEQLLQMHGYSHDVIERTVTSYHTGMFAKTDSRSVLGVLNDLVLGYRSMIMVDGGLNCCDLSSIIMQINETPQRTLQWKNAWEAVQAKLGRPETPTKSVTLQEIGSNTPTTSTKNH